ncbi:MAG: hypothetical protein ABSF29_16355 [Tepidisphaeraceae bacterium]|jgi:hypothetical protein
MAQIPNNVEKRILHRCAKNEAVVVVPRNGVPARCFGVEEYEKMRAQPLKHKPWKQRRAAAKEAPDPLGAMKLGVRSSARRQDIYE